MNRQVNDDEWMGRWDTEDGDGNGWWVGECWRVGRVEMEDGE